MCQFSNSLKWLFCWFCQITTVIKQTNVTKPTLPTKSHPTRFWREGAFAQNVPKGKCVRTKRANTILEGKMRWLARSYYRIYDVETIGHSTIMPRGARINDDVVEGSKTTTCCRRRRPVVHASTSQVQPSGSILRYLIPLSTIGQTPEKYDASDRTVEQANDSTPASTSNASSDSTTRKRKRRDGTEGKSPTLASARSTKSKTSNDKSSNSSKNAPITKFCRTLEADSIGDVRNLSPFWTTSVAEMSKKLWLPIATDLQDSQWNSWSGYSRVMEQDSWFSTKVQAPKNPKQRSYVMTCSPLSPSSSHETTENALPQIAADADKEKKLQMQLPLPDTTTTTTTTTTESKKNKKKEGVRPAERCTKIRVFPTAKQRQVLVRWFGAARWTYNQCIAKIEGEAMVARTQKDLRAAVVNNDNYKESNQWVLETPYEVRDGAMIDLLEAYKSNFAKWNKDKSHKFHMQFRSRKKLNQESIYIRGRGFKGHGFGCSFYEDSLKKVILNYKHRDEVIRAAERIPSRCDYDLQLVRTKLNKFYICVPRPLRTMAEPLSLRPVVALDPGVRTFQTCYDGANVLQFGAKDMTRLYRLARHIDTMQSQLLDADVRHRTRWRMRRAMHRKWCKIKDLVSEVHCKLVRFLVLNYAHVLLPSFETSQMLATKQSRGWRCIRSKTARQMATWSHYSFKRRLLDKAKEAPWCSVHICDEHHTSKTCGSCGKINHKLGGNKVFKCESETCRVVMDRDANAARNILLRNMRPWWALRLDSSTGTEDDPIAGAMGDSVLVV